MENRRRIIRWQINKEASIRLPEDKNPLVCNLEDINLKGMRIRSAQEIPPNTNMTLGMMLGQGFFLSKIDVSVVWQKASQRANIYGICFTRIKDSDKEIISSFVRSNFPEQIKKQLWSGLS